MERLLGERILADPDYKDTYGGIRRASGRLPRAYLDGICLKKNWKGTTENVAIFIALGMNSEGNREIIGAEEGGREDKESWQRFLRHLKERGLHGVRLMVGDKCLELVESIRETFPDAGYQRCMVHFIRNILCDVPRNRGSEVGSWLKAIFAQEDKMISCPVRTDTSEKIELSHRPLFHSFV